ncbi:hypothetical protein GM415_08150 [Pseudodesulfovibrio cashew]|uniref:SHOCT domain-containing protein n=1 Tax=Pseudodesulfovibrio cashew TaxID=2678688 RepID=A0A6I6JGG2_9BACT|nr:hypothetical protein [Pseudodesulfovibrio cashew]QGY40100.1 hypothetical protein GM415_08150 [Pseudodesulfovibrio cashew]
MEFLSAFGNWCGGPGFWQGGGHGMVGWGGGFFPFHFGGILQLVVIGLIIYFTVRMFRKPATPCGTPGPKEQTPEEILKRRYATGEIDEQTYKSIKSDLRDA